MVYNFTYKMNLTAGNKASLVIDDIKLNKDGTVYMIIEKEKYMIRNTSTSGLNIYVNDT